MYSFKNDSAITRNQFNHSSKPEKNGNNVEQECRAYNRRETHGAASGKRVCAMNTP